MKTFEVKTKKGKKKTLSIEIGWYSNVTLAIRAFDYENGYPEPYTNLTVNFDIPMDKTTAFLNVEYGNEIVDYLIEAGFGELTGRIMETDYVTFPEFKFYEDKLIEFDADNYDEYQERWCLVYE